MEGILLILDDSIIESKMLTKKFALESLQVRCDRLLVNSLDFSCTTNEFYNLMKMLKGNRFFSEVMLKGVSSYPFVASFGTPQMMNQDFVRELLRRNISCYNFIEPQYYCNDRESLLNIIANTSNCQIIGQASAELQLDKAFILKALEWNHKCYFYLKESLRKDRDVVLLVVSKEGYMLDDSDIKQFNSDKEVVKAAVMNTNSSLVHASPKLKEDREFFKNDILPYAPSLFRFAHLSLRSDCNYISELIVNFPQCIQYASPNVQGDVEFILELIKINPQVVAYVNWVDFSTRSALMKITQHDLPDNVISAIYDNLEKQTLDLFVMMSIQRNPRTLKLFHLHKGRSTIVFYAVQIDGLTLEYADHCVRKEKYIVRTACNQNPNSFKFAALSLRQDLEFVLELMEKVHPSILFQASLKPEKQIELIQKTLLNNPKLFREVYW